MPVVSSDIPEQMNEELRLLVAAGLYKSKSEALRDAIRDLSDKYHERIMEVREIRARIDLAMGECKLSDIVDEMREEEMH